MPQLTRRQYRAAVQALKPFKGSRTTARSANGHSVYAEQRGDAYVVFSYGEHFPMFVHKDGRWFKNTDRYSTTTSHQFGYCHPHCDVTGATTAELRAMLGLS